MMNSFPSGYQTKIKAILAFLLILTLTVGFSSSAIAQLSDNDKAVVAFDIRIDKLNPPRALASQMEDDALPGNVFQGIKISQMKRIFGASCLPKDIATIQGMGPDSELPMQFFVRVQFHNAEDCQKLEDNMRGIDGTQVSQEGDKTIIQPGEGDGPANFGANRVNETTMELGTIRYMLHPNRDVFAPALKSVWSQVPNDAIRIAVDLKSRSDFVDEGIQMAE